MTPEQISELDTRAQQVGAKIGWPMRFIPAPNPEYVALVAGTDQICVVGPAKLSNLAAHDIDLTLDQLERGDRTIVTDEDGDPRLR